MKQKSHSGTKKRVKVTAKGKFKFTKSSKNHLLINKSRRQKKLGQSTHGLIIDATHDRQMKKLLPYN